MPHAEASNFAADVSKQDAYAQLLASMRALVDGQRNWVCNTANAASLLWYMYHSLPGASRRVNWAGFYVINSQNREQLILAPFQGKVACQTIEVSKGVCGTVAKTGESLMLANVDEFPGHIACDGDSKSEIVVPIRSNKKIIGVIDVDCAESEGFDEDDRKGLIELATLLGESCDW